MVDMHIIEEKRNDLLGRLEIRAIVAKKEGTTPTRVEMMKTIAEKMKAKEDHIEIDGIYQKYGKQEAELKAKIWDKPVVKKSAKKAEGQQAAPEQTPEKK